LKKDGSLVFRDRREKSLRRGGRIYGEGGKKERVAILIEKGKGTGGAEIPSMSFLVKKKENEKADSAWWEGGGSRALRVLGKEDIIPLPLRKKR